MERNLHLFADPVNYCIQEEAIEETTAIRRSYFGIHKGVTILPDVKP